MMAISSLIIFGSYARGDQDSDSDVDLLGIVNDNGYNVAHLPGISLVLYSYKYLIEQAQGGNLFVWHLKEEGKSLFDAEGLFHNVSAEFKFKESYQDRINDATLVGRLLLENKNFSLNQKIACKYLLFSIRTIAISKFAESRMPFFSKKDMTSNFKDDLLSRLWEYKHKSALDDLGIELLKQFLRLHGNPELLTKDFKELNLDGYAKKVYSTFNKIVNFSSSSLYK
jgi:Nucleotidyltransferase domain